MSWGEKKKKKSLNFFTTKKVSRGYCDEINRNACSNKLLLLKLIEASGSYVFEDQ